MRTDTCTDALDTRQVFKVYAIVAWIVGGLLYGWGGLWFRAPLMAGVPYSDWMTVRLVGAVALGVGFLAIAMARTKDDDARRRALGWWAAGHAVVLAGVAVQFWALIGLEDLGWGGAVALGVLLTATVLFLFSWKTADGMPWGGFRDEDHESVLAEVRKASLGRLRSNYEEQIRAAASQEERHRLARDLHDSIKQQLFVIQTAAATAEARFGSDAAGTSAAIAQVRESAREALAEMDAMLDQLRAAPLENTGLVEALKKQCEALRFRTGADVRLSIGDLPPSESLPPGAQQAIFRVAQEALANVGRHARATLVSVTVDSTPFSVELRIHDNGVGFDAGQATTGMGMNNMRARVEPLGGVLAVTSEPGNGTLVRASVPHTPQISAADVAAYRRRALFYAAFCLIWLGGLPLWNLQRDRIDLVMWGVFMVFNCAVAARGALAYRRARRSASSATEGARTA